MKCLECKREFVLNRIDKKFCSRLCYNKHYWQGYYVKHREKILKKIEPGTKLILINAELVNLDKTYSVNLGYQIML